MKHLLLFLFVFTCSKIEVFSQWHPILNNFYAVESNGTVILNWTITGGNTCNGIQIYRSTDSLNFYQIGDIEGVCGSSTAAETYTFTDFSPEKNKVNYYRLELGQEGFTSVISIEIIAIGMNGNQVRPNPAADFTRIYFSNNKSEESTLMLCGTTGKILLRQNSNADFFDLNVSGVSTGTYVFIIYRENQLITTGRITIAR
jgi:hypothetical protein